MMRRVNSHNNSNNDALETINAAANAIASAENRVPQAAVRKRRWGSCWSRYWCFGSQKHSKKIGRAVLVPEPLAPRVDAPVENPAQTPSPALRFVAPPSSPASFLPSEPPSATQSPAGVLSLTSISANMYSPGGPHSIFAIGPYAHETQLVSPPVFSTFTTEPSTAPFTPPPESVHLTTPSSPEVPFARLLDPNYQNGEAGPRFPLSQYEFQSYQLYPGSPVSHLISPASGISPSGTSSPFPDGEFAPGHPHFLQFRTADAPQLLNLDKMARQDWGSRLGSGTLTPDSVGPKSRDSYLLDRQNSDVGPLRNSYNGWRNDEVVLDHRVSFEITEEEVVRCVEKKPAALPEVVPASIENAEPTAEVQRDANEMENEPSSRPDEASNDASEKASADGEDDQRHQKHRSITLGSAKEFNFDNVDDGNTDEPIGSDWWANEKVLGKEGGPGKHWSFFPMMQPGVS